jgi:hypothetical protein
MGVFGKRDTGAFRFKRLVDAVGETDARVIRNNGYKKL